MSEAKQVADTPTGLPKQFTRQALGVWASRAQRPLTLDIRTRQPIDVEVFRHQVVFAFGQQPDAQR